MSRLFGRSLLLAAVAGRRLASRSRTARGRVSRRNYSEIFEAKPPRILVTGALGQIGTELLQQMRETYGVENVIATDVRKATPADAPFLYADVLKQSHIEAQVVNNNIDWIVHNASILSALGEKNPKRALSINVDGLNNVLAVAARHNLRIFAPSSIAAFGPTTPKDNTPDLTIMRPTTMYGVTKVYLELIGEYYNQKFGLDFRSVRYPGILSSGAEPGGGTTDYAVEIFYKALTDKKYTCFLSKDTRLPMMYMPDCLSGTMKLLEAPAETLKQRVYNLGAIDFTPGELAEAIKKHIPEFEITYAPDFRQGIADTWPRSIDDSAARADWGWTYDYGLDEIVEDMLIKIEYKIRTAHPPRIPNVDLTA